LTPAPELEWSAYEVPAGAGAALRTLELAAPADGALTIELPNLAAWTAPLDKAELLLQSAAEVEHMLMVQYLYAAYSLKSSDEVSEPDQQAALDEWPLVLLAIAREEMGHLMTVQNLLLALGFAPNFEREDFPPRKDLYPFALHLEALTQHSLAKYVVAEAPAGPSGIDDIVALATASAGATVNRVGVLYGLLALVFSAPEQVSAGGSGSEDWDEMLRAIAAAAYQQAPAQAWHLADSAFAVRTLAQQADPDDWQAGDLRVHRIADRAAAVEAIRDVGEQGEGPTSEGSASHFERFLGIYRGSASIAPFPAAEGWVPTRAVPLDPTPDAIAEPRARLWAQLADIRYGLLLGFVEHYLLTSGGDREILAAWTFAEMRSRLAPIARMLTTMPGPDGGVGAASFGLPEVQHLPGSESTRWALHEERTQAAIAKAEQLQGPAAVDADDPYLTSMLGCDRARLALIAQRTAAPTAATSFERDILALFRPVDIEHMADQVGIDLSRYEVVRRSARSISERVRGAGGRRMPPPPDTPWTKLQTELFDRWVAEGFPP